MGNGMNKILNGLYLGNFRDSRDEVQLSQYNITHILSIHDNAKPLRSDKVYLCLDASDSPSQDLSQYFSQCNDFIHKARAEGGNVLVHCLAGVSRSATIIVAYVMSVTNYGYRSSLDAVRGARRCASPNFGFQRQLATFEHEGEMQKERERLLKLYELPASQRQQDNTDCKILIDISRDTDMRLARARTEHFASNVQSRQCPATTSDDTTTSLATSTEGAGACGGVGANPDLSCRSLRNALDELVTVCELRKGGSTVETCSTEAASDVVQDSCVSSSCNNENCKLPVDGDSLAANNRAGGVGDGDDVCAVEAEDDTDRVNETTDGITVEV